MKTIYLAFADPTLKANYRLIEHNVKEPSDFKVLGSKEIPEDILKGKTKIYCPGTDYAGLLNPGIKTTKDTSKTKYMIIPPQSTKHSFPCLYIDWVGYIKNHRDNDVEGYKKIFNKVMYYPVPSGCPCEFPTAPIHGLEWGDAKRLFRNNESPIWSQIFGMDETVTDDTVLINPSDVMFGQNNWICYDVIEFSEFLIQNLAMGNRMMLNLDVNHMTQLDADMFMMVIGGTSSIWLNNELINKCSPIVRAVYAPLIGIASQIVEGFDPMLRYIINTDTWTSRPTNVTARNYYGRPNDKDAETLLRKYKLMVDCTDHSDNEKGLLMDVLQQHVKKIKKKSL